MNTTERINGRNLSPPVPEKTKDAPRTAQTRGQQPNENPGKEIAPPPVVIVHPVPPRLAPCVARVTGAKALVVAQCAIYWTGLHVVNLTAADRYLLVFDQGSTPANGTKPSRVWTIPASSELDWDDANGRFCPGGLTVCLSTSRTTLTLVIADDGIFDATYFRAEVK